MVNTCTQGKQNNSHAVCSGRPPQLLSIWSAQGVRYWVTSPFSAGRTCAAMLKKFARPNRAVRLLLLLVFMSKAAELSSQEQGLVNHSMEPTNRRQAAVKQDAVLDPLELEKEHYGRLHASHPVRHCCVSEACASASTKVAFVASLRRCAPGRAVCGRASGRVLPARSVRSACSQGTNLTP